MFVLVENNRLLCYFDKSILNNFPSFELQAILILGELEQSKTLEKETTHEKSENDRRILNLDKSDIDFKDNSDIDIKENSHPISTSPLFLITREI